MTEIIKFDGTVVLVGGGDVDLELLHNLAHLPIVAADGGANALRHTSIIPAAVIGDLDSINDTSYWRERTQVVEIKEQDTTDFEKSLYSIDAPCFIAMGFTGSRFDHTLAALHVLQKWHGTKRVVLISGSDVICVHRGDVYLTLPVGTRVSIYPLNRITFESSNGLKYPLDDLTMQSGEMIGTSNSCSEPEVSIVPASGDGCYALILPASELGAVIKGKYAQL